MNKETYEALKDLTAYLELAKVNKQLTKVLKKELKQVNDWIDKMAKEYEEERFCVKCGKTSSLIEEEDICYTCAKERNRV